MTATATTSQLAALNWVYLRTGQRPSTTTLRLLLGREWITAATKDAELTDAGRAVLGLDPVTSVDDPRVTTDPAEREVLLAAAARLDALPTDDEPEGDPVATEPVPAPFVDGQGRPVGVGSRVAITSQGNNVRKMDVGRTGTVTATTRSRLRVAWDGPADTAPRWPVLPALVTVQD